MRLTVVTGGSGEAEKLNGAIKPALGTQSPQLRIVPGGDAAIDDPVVYRRWSQRNVTPDNANATQGLNESSSFHPPSISNLLGFVKSKSERGLERKKSNKIDGMKEATEMTAPQMVGERLRKLREAHGLSQVDACRKLDISTTRWSMWETGGGRPRYEVATYIANELQVPVGWIIAGDESGMSLAMAEKLGLRRRAG